MMRARGVRPSFSAFSSLVMRRAAAPSFSGQALPAVTVPSGLNAGRRPERPSAVVPGRGPSSLVTTLSGMSSSLPSLSQSLWAATTSS